MYLYVKAVHIVFVVTWFAGLFYVPRLFVYLAEAQSKPITERDIVTKQLMLMAKRLWYGITWPSAILTLVFGAWMWWLFPGTPQWLWIKLAFVTVLYGYHVSLQIIMQKFSNGKYNYTGQQMRMWNEVPTILLVAIVMLVSVKQSMSLVWGLVGLAAFVVLLLAAIKIYKTWRNKS